LDLQICVSLQEPHPSFTFSFLSSTPIHSIHYLASFYYYVGECLAQRPKKKEGMFPTFAAAAGKTGDGLRDEVAARGRRF